MLFFDQHTKNTKRNSRLHPHAYANPFTRGKRIGFFRSGKRALAPTWLVPVCVITLLMFIPRFSDAFSDSLPNHYILIVDGSKSIANDKEAILSYVPTFFFSGVEPQLNPGMPPFQTNLDQASIVFFTIEKERDLNGADYSFALDDFYMPGVIAKTFSSKYDFQEKLRGAPEPTPILRRKFITHFHRATGGGPLCQQTHESRRYVTTIWPNLRSPCHGRSVQSGWRRLPDRRAQPLRPELFGFRPGGGPRGPRTISHIFFVLPPVRNSARPGRPFQGFVPPPKDLLTRQERYFFTYPKSFH